MNLAEDVEDVLIPDALEYYLGLNDDLYDPEMMDDENDSDEGGDAGSDADSDDDKKKKKKGKGDKKPAGDKAGGE